MKGTAEATLDDYHALDLAIPCPNCKCLVAAGKPCEGTANGIVHFARRLKWLLATVRARS